MDALRVLLVDDHPLYRSGLALVLAGAENVEVVGEATAGTEAVEMVEELQPDVVVMDLRIPGLDGIEATRRITCSSPHVGILVLTMFEDDDSVFAAMRAGARGYLLKGAHYTDIIRAVQAVGRGEAIFAPRIARRVMQFFSTGPPPVQTVPFPELTDREREVLELIALGHPNADIAGRLFLSPKTVRNHVSNIFTKLQVADRSNAIIRARQAGMGRGA